jgi:hypothetical protein
MATNEMSRYSFQLLRFVPNLVSEEHFNIGVFLYDAAGDMLDARMAGDFRRLACHPLVEMQYLEALRNEFEERRLAGEGFSLYAEQLMKNLSTGLQVSKPKAFWGQDPVTEIERLYSTYVATPSRPEMRAEDGGLVPGTRRALRHRMQETFGRYHLLANGKGLQPEVSVNYGGPRLRFTFDYAYQPNGSAKYVHGLALRNDVNDAAKLCFVIERLRGQTGGGASAVSLTAVLDDGIQDDTRELLESSEIVTCPLAKLDELALEIRNDLGL